MTENKRFSIDDSPSLTDQSMVRFDEEGNPLKTEFREDPADSAPSVSVIPQTEQKADEIRTKVRELVPLSQKEKTSSRHLSPRKPGKIIRLSPAKLNVGGISKEAYRKKHGLAESGFHRFVRRKVKEPIGKGLMKAGDFFVKAYGQSYLDRFDMLRLKLSDKNNNYSRGMIPKPIRTPLSLFGTPAMGNIPSLFLGSTFLGKRFNNYRQGRRGRVDNMKRFLAKPFRRVTTNVSSKLPLHERRYKVAQRFQGIREWIAQGEERAKAMIDGGMSGVLARRRQKKAFREQQERLGEKRKALKNSYSASFVSPHKKVVEGEVPQEGIDIPRAD